LEIIRYLAPSGVNWYFVFPCPNAEGLALFQENESRAAAQREKVAKLVADLQDPLRAELLRLLNQHRKIDAIHRYQQAAGVDLTEAVQVIQSLIPLK